MSVCCLLVVITLIVRAFYTCPLNRDDPNKCKFFKWEDELQSASTSTTPQKPIQGGRTLGQSPQVNYARTPTKSAPASTAAAVKAEEDVDGIDWNKVNTDDLEHQAILSTPGSSQAAAQDSPTRARLRAAVDAGLKKREHEDDETQTPKRARHESEVSPETPGHLSLAR